MATTKKRKAAKASPGRDRRTTTSFDVIQTIHAACADVDIVLVAGSGKREEVLIRSRDILRMARIGRFGFVEYHPSWGLRRTRVFVDDEDTGVERRDISAALVYAVAFASVSEHGIGGFSPDEIPFMAEAVCRLIGVVNQ